MRRAFLAFVALMVFSLPGTAFAEDWTPEGSSDSEVEDSRPLPPEDVDDRDIERHHHLDELYDDVEMVTLPPIGIKPGNLPNPNFFQLPDGADQFKDAESQFHVFQLGNGSTAKIPMDPSKSEPVEIKNIVLTRATPSDEFLNGALAWGVGLATTAFGLLAFASMNSLRLRKKAKKQ